MTDLELVLCADYTVRDKYIGTTLNTSTRDNIYTPGTAPNAYS
jgi:hypothetical protein